MHWTAAAVFVALFSCSSRCSASWPRAGAAAISIGSTSGGSPAASSARSSPGFCSAAISTRRTRSSPCPRSCSAPARSASSRCRTRCSIYPFRVRRVSAALVGRAQARLHHRVRLRRAAGSAADRWRSPSRSPAFSRRCRTSRCSWWASRSWSPRMGFTATGSLGDLPLIIAFVDPGGVHVQQRAARAGADRARQGRADLRRRSSPAIVVIPAAPRRLRRDLPSHSRRRKLLLAPPQPGASAVLRVCDARARLGAGAVSLSARDHGPAEREQPQRHQAERGAAAGVFGRAGAAGARSASWRSRPAWRRSRSTPRGFARYGANFAVPALFLDQFPDWFVGVAFAAIAIGALVPGRDHVDRGRQSVHAQHLSRSVPRPAAPARPRRPPPSACRSSSSSARSRSSSRCRAIRDSAAAARRRLDHPDVAGRRDRPVHALVPRPRADARLARGHGGRHGMVASLHFATSDLSAALGSLRFPATPRSTR